MTASEQFHDAMSAMGRLMREAEKVDPTLLNEEEMARWVAALRGGVKRLRDLDTDASAVLGKVLPPRTPTLLAGNIWEATTSTKRTGWDNDRVRRDVIRSATYDPDTGAQRTADEAIEIIGKLYSLGGSGLRLTAARDLIPDWSDDEYCRVERSTTVKLTESAGLEVGEKENPHASDS